MPGWWCRHVLPRIVDRSLGNEEISRYRRRALSAVAGEVLEIGFGSGLNLAHYPNDVAAIWAVEPSDLAWGLAQPRIGDFGRPVHRAGADGQRLDLPAERFDAVVSTFTMCTIPDLDASLSELWRVLRPGGQLHFLEHGRAGDAEIAKWQDRLQPLNGRLGGGCRINRPLGRYLDRSPLRLEALENFYARGPKPFGYAYVGRAGKD